MGWCHLISVAMVSHNSCLPHCQVLPTNNLTKYFVIFESKIQLYMIIKHRVHTDIQYQNSSILKNFSASFAILKHILLHIATGRCLFLQKIAIQASFGMAAAENFAQWAGAIEFKVKLRS
jgi:hypothetical protein